jgi:hypothetical protein
MAKIKCAIPATKTKQPMTTPIAKENVRGRMTAKITQTKTFALQSISHPDAFLMTGAIDSTFIETQG